MHLLSFLFTNYSQGATGNSIQQQSNPSTSSFRTYPEERRALYDKVSRNVTSPAFKRPLGVAHHESSEPTVGGARENPAMSFVMLTDSQVVQPAPTKQLYASPNKNGQDESLSLDGASDTNGKAMSTAIETATRLFDILSAKSEVGPHPVCVECTELLVDSLTKRLETHIRERDAYVGFLKKIKSEVPTEEDVQESQEALEKARAQEAASIEELVKLEKERGEVEDEIAALEEEAKALDIEEEKFWRSRNAFAEKLSAFQEERDSINLKYDHDSQQLEKLQRTNVYNDTFCISHDGRFGTINSLRLGRLSNVPVDWPEINAAWGHTLLLLATVAERLNYQFPNHRLRPMGSTSRIEKYEYPTTNPNNSGSSQRSQPKISVLELYSSGDLPLGLTFHHRKFDNAMVAFLECLRELGVHVQETTANTGQPLKLPYEISKDRIGGVSIRLGAAAQDDAWSKACKFTLTCCKFLLAHASNVNTMERRLAAQ